MTATTFAEADKAWGRELQKKFGREAGDIRYIECGKGDAGTELRRLWLARQAAYLAWCREITAKQVKS